MDNLPKEEEKVGFNINTECIKQNSDKNYIYNYTFDIKYQLLCPIIKDIQMVSQLIKFIKNHQLSDLIFIVGDNSYSIDSRFYFNYRHIIDFYIKVINSIETENFIKIKYNIYKTSPISKNFYVTLSLSKNDDKDKSSKLELEIILEKDSIISPRILKIIYNEFNYNFLYLSQAIKSQKNNSFFYNSSIIKNDFYILTQIIQNVKLIEYIINGKFQKINNNNKKDNNKIYINNSDNDKFIHKNEIYKIVLNKKKEINDWLDLNNISFKIETIIAREDSMVIHLRILLNNNENDKKETDYLNNLTIVNIRKLTNNSSFVLIKSACTLKIGENFNIEFKKILKKTLKRIEKISQISNEQYNC
jgi:hypothetical protein